MRVFIILLALALSMLLLLSETEGQRAGGRNRGGGDHQTTTQDTRQPATRRRKKPKKAKIACPDTCQLKRKVGKVEASMEARFTSLEEMCFNNSTNEQPFQPNNIADVSLQHIEAYLDQLHRNLSHQVQTEVDESIGELKDLLTQGQRDIRITAEEVNELVRSIPVALAQLGSQDPSPPQSSTSELSDAVHVMNITIRRLKQQNTLLQKRTKEAEDVATVVRNQNHIISSQNRDLRLHSLAITKKTRDFQKKLEGLEHAVAYLNESRNNFGSGVHRARQREDMERLEQRIRSAETTAEANERRLASVENWIQAAAQGGLPLSLPTTTVLPQPDDPPNDCQELYQMGFHQSGVYTIRPWQARESFDVFCEQNYYGGGWTLIQKRRDGSVDFNRDWDDYTLGFGDLQGEFWLGNDKIHSITNQNTYRLHIVLLDWEDRRVYAEYDGFRLSSSRDYFSLRFGRYEGTAGDGLRGSAEDGSTNLYLSRFGTRDLDNDSCRPCMYEGEAFENCAQLHNSGWWYRACADSNLNGPYVSRENLTNCEGGDCLGIQWRTWHDEANYSLRGSIMMIKIGEAEEEN